MRRVNLLLVLLLLLLGLPGVGAGVTLPTQCTATAGALISSSDWNTCITAVQTELTTLQVGGIKITGQAIGDLLTANSTATFTRIPAVAAGQILASQGTGTAPAWSSTLVLSGTGPHAIGGAIAANVQLYIRGTFPASGLASPERGILHQPTLSPTAGQPGIGFDLIPTINIAASGVHADFVGLNLQPPTITAGAGSLTNASTLKITGAPSGATNNYALWVVAGTIRNDGTLFDLTNSAAQIRLGVSPNQMDVSITSGNMTFNNSGVGERMRLTTAGVLALGTTVVTGASPGNIVLPNGIGILGVNAAGNGTIPMMFINASDLVAFGKARTAVSVAANFSADFYIRFQDLNGAEFYVPAKNAAW